MLPEEQELNRLESEQTALEEQVISTELTLETLKTQTAQFQYHYNQTIGRLFAELDEIRAKIARIHAGLAPENKQAQVEAEEAIAQAQRSAEEAGISEKQPEPPPEITPELKRAVQKARRLMFPDHFPADSEEHKRRTAFMSKVNVAYNKGDQATVEKLIVEFGEDHAAITGENVGSRLIKVIRYIAQLRRRLNELEQETEILKESELYELMVTVNETKEMGGNPLNELEQQLLQQISELKIELEMVQF